MTEGSAVARQAGDALGLRGWTVAVAESCTGGLVSKLLTDIPGSSRYVKGGVVAYDNEVKVGVLGVDRKTLESDGAVSEEVARQMAIGVARALGSDVGVSLTGIAGPGGGQCGKPVGTVWFGVSTPEGTHTESVQLPGARDAVREAASRRALALLVEAARPGADTRGSRTRPVPSG